jgi:hypothetical protein
MATRWPILVAIAIAGGVAWLALRTDGPDKAETPASPGSEGRTTPPKVAISAPQPPSLDAGVGSDRVQPALPPTLSPEAAFTAQNRDTDWAPSTEDEIRRRFKKVRGAKLSEAECRQSQCRIIVAGTQADVSRTIADLESDRGLHGFAQNILLTAPERKPDGSLVLRAFALFER